MVLTKEAEKPLFVWLARGIEYQTGNKQLEIKYENENQIRYCNWLIWRNTRTVDLDEQSSTLFVI